MVRKFVCLLFFSVIASAVFSQGRISRAEYIARYENVAMGNMVRTGIPASITLAQGCLESDNGNSRLARKANNHFGIKCHDWKGKKIRHDDDERNECFRKYDSPWQSFDDHSIFLTTTSRYASLFALKPDDYKGWARGLKKAGYATSNRYARLLINIIEENGLDKYDAMVLSGKFEAGEDLEGLSEEAREDLLTRKTQQTNRVEYVIVEAGDSPSSLREEFDLYPFELYRYNDIKMGDRLKPGMKLYLQPKRWRAAKGNEVHVVQEGETMRDISQKYAVKLRRLYKRNRLSVEEEPREGSEIWLRRKKPEKKNEPTKPEKQNDDNGDTEMEFQFDG